MKLLSNLSLKWKLSLGFGVLLGLMITVSSTVYLNLGQMKTSSQWVEHTHEAIRLGDEITLSLVNMETGLRGFLMAGKDQFLEPYDQGQIDFKDLMATAKKHVSDNPTQVARLNEIEQLKQRWESEHVNVAIAMRQEVNENSDAIQTFKEISARTVGKEKFDGFRAALSKLDEKFIQSNDIKAQSLVKLLLIDMINQETGQRGFLLSGKEESLEPYDEGKKAFDNHISNMNDLIQHAYDRVEAKENVDAVKQIISDWEHKVALVGIELRKQSAAGQLSNDYVTEFVLKGTGKQFFDQSRENIAALTEEFKTSNDLLALELVTRLAKNMVDMETGYRGFLLTGKPSSLEPYNSGKVEFQKTLGGIEQLIAKAYNVEEANTLLNAAVELAKDWDTHAAQPEIEARQKMNKVARTVDDIANFVELGIGKKHMDAMREELKAFIGAEFALIGERSEKNHTVADNTTTVTLVGTLLAAGFGGLLALFLVRNITRTLNQAGTIANKIADDDYSTEISAPSQDELGQLIESLGTMQSKLKQRTETERRVAAENNRIKQALDNVSGNVMILDDKLDIIYTNHSIERMFRSGAAQFTNHLPSFNTSLISGQNVSVLLPQHQVLNKLTKTEVLKTQVGQNTYEITANSVLNDEHAPVAVVLEWKDRSQELAIESEIQNVVDSSRSGDLSQRIDLDGKRGFQAMLSQGINDLVNASELVINDSLHVMHALSHGDLTKSIDANYEGTFELLKQDTNASIEKLTEVVTEIRGSADAVLTATRQMAHGNMNLSQRTEEQASNLQSTSSSMEEMTATVKQNADSARQANKLAVNACSQAVKGQDIVISAVTAMEQITTSSEQIADIIGVIDEIAFQTNLLALNAAVEAARAGEQGRGFAVVASEVRTLASRSAEAAKEIKELIEDSVTKVNEGAKLVNDSGETLQQITGSVTQVSDIIGQIASASEEQSLGIEQVNNAITQLDNTTQQNAALVEEAAASSELMEQQAEKLNNLVGFFSMQSDKRFSVRGNSRDHNESALV